eukprot:CAMPEP_0184491406 /NCGR_PEP_ID=MMETSP0113_2-20130426/20354_1 /TAXON_ID=91329 /ORGANISM="Norrisiella sphaerica, Strain BC52" /LENGTH=102 /DNA_ID=CAMNT_0026875767 /DNA_START=22 /DNA_END=330 /DNA_ORIENTATION=+
MSALGRSLRRVIRPSQLRVRTIGGHGSPEEIKQGMEWWKKVTYVSLPVVAGALVLNLFAEIAGSHHHDTEGPNYGYMKIRNKPYPWGKGDCNFFDLQCRRNE